MKLRIAIQLNTSVQERRIRFNCQQSLAIGTKKSGVKPTEGCTARKMPETP
jgi:hypothetical protein